jgi:hypothetical protein
MARDVPLDYLISHFLKTRLDLRDIDIFAPSLLALAARLLILRRRCSCIRHYIFTVVVLASRGVVGCRKKFEPKFRPTRARATWQDPPSTPAPFGSRCSRCWPSRVRGLQFDQHSYSDTAPRQDTELAALIAVCTLSPLLLFTSVASLTHPSSWRKRGIRIRSRSSSEVSSAEHMYLAY